MKQKGNNGADNDFISPLWNYSLSYISGVQESEENQCPGYKLIVGLGQNFECKIDGQVLTGLRGLLINRDVSHAIASGVPVLIYIIEPDCLWGWQAGALLEENNFLDLNGVLDDDQLSNVLPPGYATMANTELLTYVHALLDAVFYVDHFPKGPDDEHIEKISEILDTSLNMQLTAAAITSQLGLSAERFEHFFIQRFSIPFTRYVLWGCIRGVLSTSVQRNDVPEETIKQFGFRDSSHFSYCFEEVSGADPFELVRECRVVI